MIRPEQIRLEDIDSLPEEELYELAKKAYKSESYHLCVSICERLINELEVSNYKTYKLLGDAYEKLQEADKASRYLSLAASKKTTQRTPAKRTESPFRIKKLREYEELKLIAQYAPLEQLEKEYTIFNITDEELLIIKLIYAINYYKRGMYSEGDKLLAEVLESQNLSKEILDIIAEINTAKSDNNKRK